MYPGGCLDSLRARLSVCLARDSVRGAAVVGRTIYACHERGFALFSMRSPEITRLYIQVAPEEDIGNWPDDRIWQELHARLETDDRWMLGEGPVLTKESPGCAALSSSRCTMAGSSSPATRRTSSRRPGAKGMNLAVADVRVLARALAVFTSGSNATAGEYSESCLSRVWRAEHFSWWMTSMLHRFPTHDGFQQRLQRSQLDYVSAREPPPPASPRTTSVCHGLSADSRR